MISLENLPLLKTSIIHHKELENIVNKRFARIDKYFHELDKLKGYKRYPGLQIANLLTALPKKIRPKVKPSKHDLANTNLHKTHLEILALLRPSLDITLKGNLLDIDILVNKIKDKLKDYIDPSSKKFRYLNPIKPFIEFMKYVWDYELFIVKDRLDSHWDAYRLARELDIQSCPYCNRIHTHTVIVKGTKSDKIVRPEFDHFYSKSRYPFLALCFYNLVPSCSICNSTLKGDIEMSISTHCHPYLEGFEDIYRFRTGISVKDFLKEKNPKVPIIMELLPKNKADHILRAEENLKIFKIREIYPYHNDIAEEIFKKATEDSKKLIQGFWEQKSPNGNYLFPNKADLYRNYIGNHLQKKDFHKRSMSKFYHDLVEEAELLDYIHSLPDHP